MKILDNISDYFIGNEIRNFYAKERAFYMSHCLESKNLDKKLDKLARDERKYIVLGKVMPNIIDISSIAWSCYAKSALPLIFTVAAEGLRKSMIEEFAFKKNEYLVNQSVSLMENFSTPKNIEKIAGAINNLDTSEKEDIISQMDKIIKESEELLRNHDCNKCDKK